MPVGNDVVDLQDPANQPSAIHPRFDERVFSDEELRRLEALDGLGRHRLRWTLWAARESAYKHILQQEAGIPFRPGEMSVRLDDPAAGQLPGRVEWNEREIEVRADCRADRVHVVTLAADGRAPARDLRRISGDAGGDAEGPRAKTDPHAVSAAVRLLAAGTVARVLGLAAADVRVVAPSPKDGRVAPRALRAGEPLPVDLSMSHDGDWIASAVVSSRRGLADAP